MRLRLHAFITIRHILEFSLSSYLRSLERILVAYDCACLVCVLACRQLGRLLKILKIFRLNTCLCTFLP